jgi:cbb3-type cytochrome oxidase maturation protein
MSVLFVALPVAILLGGSALVACIYCIKGGQYDDLESPAVRVLIDDVPVRSKTASESGLDKRRDENC